MMATLPATSEASTSSSVIAFNGMSRMAPLRQVLLLIGIAASVAIGVVGAMSVLEPPMNPLEHVVDQTQAREVRAAFEPLGLHHEWSGGVLLVDSTRHEEAVSTLLERGLITMNPSGPFAGDEAPGPLDRSSESDRQRYQHKLERYIAGTISDMASVMRARVHLAIPRRTPFVGRDDLRGSASVLVHVAPGRRLSEGQVGAIVNMVSQAVSGIDPQSVTVTDQSGRQLNEPESTNGMSRAALKYTESMERSKLAKINRLLTPITGPGGFAAEVSAEFDFTTVEVGTERVDPERSAILSQSETSDSLNGAGAGGPPGALSNTPPGAAFAPEVANGADGVPGASSSRQRTQQTTNYQVTKELAREHQFTPRLLRLSVAVTLDDLKVRDADGTVTGRAWLPEELSEIEQSIRTVVGFNGQRGDSIHVVNRTFAPIPEIEPTPEPPIWEQPWVWSVARHTGIGLLALIILFGVLKPMMRNLVNRDVVEREALLAVQTAERENAESANGESLRLGHQGDVGGFDGPGAFEQQLDAARGAVASDPRRAANVMKDWVAQNG
jgi:flagellar M-ring protein FliF